MCCGSPLLSLDPEYLFRKSLVLRISMFDVDGGRLFHDWHTLASDDIAHLASCCLDPFVY